MNRRRAHLQSLHLYCLSCLLFCVAFNEDHCAGVDFYKPRNFVLQNKNKSTVPTLKQNVRSGRPLNEIIFPDRTPPPEKVIRTLLLSGADTKKMSKKNTPLSTMFVREFSAGPNCRGPAEHKWMNLARTPAMLMLSV